MASEVDAWAAVVALFATSALAGMLNVTTGWAVSSTAPVAAGLGLSLLAMLILAGRHVSMRLRIVRIAFGLAVGAVAFALVTMVAENAVGTPQAGRLIGAEVLLVTTVVTWSLLKVWTCSGNRGKALAVSLVVLLALAQPATIAVYGDPIVITAFLAPLISVSLQALIVFLLPLNGNRTRE